MNKSNHAAAAVSAKSGLNSLMREIVSLRKQVAQVELRLIRRQYADRKEHRWGKRKLKGDQ
jgi:hypothetical protein